MSEKTVMAQEPRRSGWVVGLIILALLVICCCGVVAIGWFFGDTLVGELSPLLQ